MGGEMPAWNAWYAPGSASRSLFPERWLMSRFLPAEDSDRATDPLNIHGGNLEQEMEIVAAITTFA